MKDEIKEKDIIQKSIECLSKAKFNDTTYEVARDIILDYITYLQERIKYLERSNDRREDTILGLRQELATENLDWFTTILKNMIKDKSTMVSLGKIKIFREKDDLTNFNFNVSIKKSAFEDVLSEEEKSMLWLEGEK